MDTRTNKVVRGDVGVLDDVVKPRRTELNSLVDRIEHRRHGGWVMDVAAPQLVYLPSVRDHRNGMSPRRLLSTLHLAQRSAALTHGSTSAKSARDLLAASSASRR
jgi:hypothetical protein